MSTHPRPEGDPPGAPGGDSGAPVTRTKRSRARATAPSRPGQQPQRGEQAGGRQSLRTAPDPDGSPARPGPESIEQMRLTGDRIMVSIPADRERRSKTGLLIPATAASTHKRCIWSDVVLVGPETRGVRSGDLVLFIPQSGIEVEVDGETYLLLRERDVQAIASERIDPHAGQYL